MDSCNSKDELWVIKLAKLGCLSPSPTDVDENWVISIHVSPCTQFSIGVLYALLLTFGFCVGSSMYYKTKA